MRFAAKLLPLLVILLPLVAGSGRAQESGQPAGARFAYEALSGEKWCVVIDETEQRQYKALLGNTLNFSADGKHVVYADDREGKSRFPEIFNVCGGHVVFDSADTFHYIGRKEGVVYLVEEKIR